MRPAQRWHLWLLIGIVLLIRLPFLNQAVQGDDPKFLFVAQHALIDPLHPAETQYVFQGEYVDMRGYPHPPFNSWMLAGLIAIFGDVSEVPFHAVYVLFSLIAVLSMWSMAKRWSPDPLAATLLFIAVPAFVVNGNSFESDTPFLAFWMASIALFTAGRPWLAIVPLAVAAMTSYQAIFATPILLVWLWFNRPSSKAPWAVAFTPVLVFAFWQVYERLTRGALPATVLAGYMSSYGVQQLANKLRNAAALTVHLGWMVFPVAIFAAFRKRWYVALAAAVAGVFIDPNPLFWVPFAAGAMVLASLKFEFLEAWILIFFTAALVVFFAGSARYLLPIAAPLSILVARRVPKLVLPCFAVNLALGLALAYTNYQHWDGYRSLTASLAKEMAQKRVWLNGEWASFYMENEGALPLLRSQNVQSGEWVVTSDLGFPIQITAPLGLVREQTIQPALPFRLIGLGSRSGYSTVSQGLRAFDIMRAPVDRVRVEAVLERKPTLSWLPMNAAEAGHQLVSGVYQQEGDNRWMSGRAVLLLKKPDQAKPIAVDIYIPPNAPARSATLRLDGNEILKAPLTPDSLNRLVTPPVSGSTLTIELDKTFRVAGDYRDLGAVLAGAGFR